METSYCEKYSPDKMFQRFRVLEFPITFVGLSSKMLLEVDVNLNTSTYIKTLCDGRLMNFEDARKTSAHHRAFDLTQIDEHSIEICFKPTNECISKAKGGKHFDDRFVFDIHLIEACHLRCCENENHAEIGRYYICGQFEYSQITHYPKSLDFGHLLLNNKVTKAMRITNNSKNITSKLCFIKVTGFDVVPAKFSLPPTANKRLYVSLRPTNLQVAKYITFHICNVNILLSDLEQNSSDNYIKYKVLVNCNVNFEPNLNICSIESLHKLYEKNPIYTFTDEELITNCKRKTTANLFLETCKATRKSRPSPEKVLCLDNENYCCNLKVAVNRPSRNFCTKIRRIIPIYELYQLKLDPNLLNFGRVSLSTCGVQYLKVKNNSEYEIFVTFLKDECVTYTKDKKPTFSFKINPLEEFHVTVWCLGFVEGSYNGTFEYIIENKFCLQHPYILQVGNPTLMIIDKSLKFGMVTAESFVTSVPVTVHNNFNVPVEFQWESLDPDAPFKMYPSCGRIPSHSCRICDIQYLCKPTKTKSHEIDFISCGHAKKVIPVELSIFTRKHSIKFLQVAVVFKDLPLNIEVSEKVKIENPSKEFAVFHVVEPLIPGFSVEPLHGFIKPKMVLTVEIKVKISCVLEFSFEISVKINNKETIILPVSGNVVEPKVTIHPKNIYLARIPCYLISYVPIIFQNISTAKALISILDTGDDNIFKLYIANGNEKQQISQFIIYPGETRTVYMKVYDIFRREYDMYLPFRVNDLLGPPDKNSWTTDLQYYINKYEKIYENNPKIKVKRPNRDISYCRVVGVITLPWIEFSQDKFEFDNNSDQNCKEFTMTNISKYNLPVTIITSKLAPNFTLNMLSEEYITPNENNIKFELPSRSNVQLSLNFHPKGYGRFVTVAIFYLDKYLSIPYSNLTFIGKRELPTLIPTNYKIMFPPCDLGVKVSRTIDLVASNITTLESLYYESSDKNITVTFVKVKSSENLEGPHVITAEVCVFSENIIVRNTIVKIFHLSGACCEIEVCYCYSYCALTLHANLFADLNDNPYPYFPSNNQENLYRYMKTCSAFLEKWLFQQGFRRDFFPVIPGSFHIISSSLTSEQSGSKPKGINVSYLNFIRRVAGPFMKYIQKTIITEPEGDFKYVMEIHNTYKEIINLLKCRGADIWIMQAKYLLSYDQFTIYCENVPIKTKTDEEDRNLLLSNVHLFMRLNKQCWIDFILQTYKVFVLDSCFFDCICVSEQHRDIVHILVDWFNKQIESQYHKLLKKNRDSVLKIVTNLTTDLSDGIAIVSAILNHCPFMNNHFSIFYEVDEDHRDGYIIHNTCLIIEAMNQLKLYFPLNRTELLQPNFLQMLFLSVHLYVVLPLFRPKDTIKFNPPLSRSSTRQVSIYPSSQESLIYNSVILNNGFNAFTTEKTLSPENPKKVLLNVKYQANFVEEVKATLIVQGYNKTRIFDSYVVFYLRGCIGSLIPHKKCKIICPLCRPNKSDILISSPFSETADFNMYILDMEPTIPVNFDTTCKSKFFVRRVNIMENTITLRGIPKEVNTQEAIEQKICLFMTCLSTQIGNEWIWFKSDIGEFFIKITTQPRWDLALDMIQAKMTMWPVIPCSCGEACECYRTTVLLIPHKNELMVKSLRIALVENASNIMMNIFDELIDTVTGKLILAMLLEETGTDMSEVLHILRNDIVYRITSRTLQPQLDKVKLRHHSDDMLTLPVTIPQDSVDKYSLTFTSECGMDIRTYRVVFIENTLALEDE